MGKCFRCGEEATYQTKLGKNVCNRNAAKCKAIRVELSKKKKGIKPWNTGKRGLQTSWSKGLTKLSDSRLKEKGERFSDNYKKGKYKKPSGMPLTEEKKEQKRKKCSEAILLRYKDGWMPKAGRCKKINYISKFCGEVLLDGTWELKVAEYFEQQNIYWERNKKKFPYIHQNKERTYTPDFYLKELDLFIEVKGYETDLDKAKWSQFPSKLKVLYKKEIDQIKSGEILKW